MRARVGVKGGRCPGPCSGEGHAAAAGVPLLPPCQAGQAGRAEQSAQPALEPCQCPVPPHITITTHTLVHPSTPPPLATRSIIVEGGTARGITTAGGAERRAQAVLANADPFRLRQLAGGAATFPSDFNARLDAMRRDGTTMKASKGRGMPVGRYSGSVLEILVGAPA